MSRQRQTTSRRRARAAESLPFANKLVLNQWMISLFGIDPLREQRIGNQVVRPFHALVDPIKDPRLEGLDESNIHHFYHHLVNAPFFAGAKINAIQLLAHEENLVRHTQRINEKRYRPVVWKYYQWLTLLFTDIFLDKYFRNRAALLAELNEFIERVNARWEDYADILPYTEDDLNKLCYQNATGSGKTLIMHVNLLQHQHYARRAGREDDFSRVILLTPNERLSEQHLKEEGLPGNERKQVFTIPLNVTYDFGKKLKMLRPKQKAEDGREYDFKYDAPVPTLGEIPDYLQHNTVVSDWYPRIQAMRSTGNDDARTKQKGVLQEHHLALLDYDQLFFELEQFKRERSWYNLNIAKATFCPLLQDASWYTLYIPPAWLELTSYDNVRLWQQVAAELLKRYCDAYYNYCKSAFIEPRLELRELTSDDDNFPEDNQYQLIVDGSEEQVIQDILRIKKELEERTGDLLQAGNLFACNFDRHLYQPLLYVRKGGKIKVMPVALNESEYQFVQDLRKFCDANKTEFTEAKKELFLLRNMSRGRGVGFFEAGNFHPDFIMWLLDGGKQYVTFIEPHGLQHEGPASKKVQFQKKIKEVEARLGDPQVILNSFIVSWTKHAQLDWGLRRSELEEQHILFMTEDRDHYIEKLFANL